MKILLIGKEKVKIYKNGNIFVNNKKINSYIEVYEKVNIGGKTYRLHNLLVEAYKRKLKKDEIVDHIDNNPLNNSLDNLRIITKQENSMNRNKTKEKTTSIYKGVIWDKSRRKWKARIKLDGKSIYLGRYEFEEEAALAYNKKAKEIFKEYANLNKVKGRKNKKPRDKKQEEVTIKGEKWRRCNIFKERKVFVSNYGRVKYYHLTTKNEIITKGSKTGDGYYRIALKSEGTSKTYRIHQLIANTFLDYNLKSKLVVDHIDNNRLNNKLKNLRVVEKNINAHNKKKKKGTSSKYIGVHYYKEKGKWRASIQIEGIKKHIGYYKTEKEANIAYKKEIKIKLGI